MNTNNDEVRYIIFKNKDNVFLKKRILTIYELENSDKDYVIFYDDDNDMIESFGIASFDKDTDFKNLNLDLNENELKHAKMIIDAIKKGE